MNEKCTICGQTLDEHSIFLNDEGAAVAGVWNEAGTDLEICNLISHETNNQLQDKLDRMTAQLSQSRLETIQRTELIINFIEGMASMANELGKKQEAAHYLKAARLVKSSFVKREKQHELEKVGREASRSQGA